MKKLKEIKISVITTTKNNPIGVVELASSLYPFYKQLHEFIIVDANVHHKTVLKREFSTVIDCVGTNRSGGKNVGIKYATGNVFVFLDDDVRVTSNWLKQLKKSMQHADIVAGYSPDPKEKYLPRVSIYIKGQDITWPTCNIAYRKEVFNKVGFFDENLPGAEDIDFNKRCVDKGYIIIYDPRVKVFHQDRKGWLFAKQVCWNGYCRKLFNKKYPELKHAHQHGLSLKNFVRLCFGAIGYGLGNIIYQKGVK